VRLADFSIRPGSEADFPLIEGLVRQTRLNPAGLDWRHFVVAFSVDGDFMGCGQVKPHGRNLPVPTAGTVRELASIAVRKRYRGLGVASAMIDALLAAHPRPVYLMCRSGLMPFYENFGFKILLGDDVPKYFRRVRRVMAGLEVVQQMQETILVMGVN
jgi:GNAT superfamily N-acetyltransferase